MHIGLSNCGLGCGVYGFRVQGLGFKGDCVLTTNDSNGIVWRNSHNGDSEDCSKQAAPVYADLGILR